MDWLMFLATLGLLGVTYWYAKTTKRMADTARDAARDSLKAIKAAERSAVAAENSAQIATNALRVAQSQVDVSFKGRATIVSRGDEFDPDESPVAVIIESTGDPVVVREVRVRRAFRAHDHGYGSGELIEELSGQSLQPMNDDSALPLRLHQNETLLLTHSASARPPGHIRRALERLL